MVFPGFLAANLLEVGLAPHPDDLKFKILDLINDVTKVTSSLMCIEYEAWFEAWEPQRTSKPCRWHLVFHGFPWFSMIFIGSSPHQARQLVPFCNLPQHLMFDLPTEDAPLAEVELLRAAKLATAEVIEECLSGPREVQARRSAVDHTII